MLGNWRLPMWVLLVIGMAGASIVGGTITGYLAYQKTQTVQVAEPFIVSWSNDGGVTWTDDPTNWYLAPTETATTILKVSNMNSPLTYVFGVEITGCDDIILEPLTVTPDWTLAPVESSEVTIHYTAGTTAQTFNCHYNIYRGD